MIYSRTETHEGNDCLITKDAHIVEVCDTNGGVIGYVATCSTIYRGWMGFDTRSQSFVYDNEHKQDAIDWCESFFDCKKGINE